MTDTEKRVEFERELAHLINRLSLECTFGNRPDFVLATLAWDALAATAETANGTAHCPICGIDEPHSLESLRAKLRETERDIEERERMADGGMVRALESWLDLYEKAIDAHEVAAKRLTKHTRDCDRQSAYNVNCVCGFSAATAEPATPTGPQMDAVIKDGKFIRPATPAPTYSADDLRKVAHAVAYAFARAMAQKPMTRRSMWGLPGVAKIDPESIDLDAIIAKAVGK